MSIKLDQRNYRKHSKKNKELINKSLKECGAGRSIVIDKEDNIIAGNGIYEQAQKLGIKTKIIETDGTELVVVKRTDLATEDEKRKQLAIMDNSASDSSEFDYELLQLDFNIETLDNWGIERLEIIEEQKEIEEDEVPENVETRCKLGDIWKLGNHRLLCGDSTVLTDVERLIEGNKVDLVFTDPPYNMHYSGFGIIPENPRVQKLVDFDPYSIEWLNRNDFGSIYIFTSKDLIPDYLKIFQDWKFNILVWEKTNNPPLTMNTFLPDIEYLLYFHKGKRIFNNGLKPTEIYKKVFSSSRQEGQKGIGNVHPTMKPIDLIANKLRISSNPNSIVLDLFGGSGSTLIACEQLNRTCYMMELDPHYCDVIITRWENLTGQKALLVKE